MEVPFVTEADIPAVFALKVKDSLFTPEIQDGDEAVFSCEETPHAGDLAVFIMRPEMVPAGGLQCFIRRLVSNLPSDVTLPYRDNPKSEVRMALVFETPGKDADSAIRCSSLLGLAKFSRIQRRALA